MSSKRNREKEQLQPTSPQGEDVDRQEIVEPTEEVEEQVAELQQDIHSEAARGLISTSSPVDESPFVPESISENVQSIVQPQQAKAGSSMSKVEQELTIYQEKMLGKLTQEEVGKVQYGLFNTMRGILGKEDFEAARQDWNTLLKFANNNSDAKTGAFNEYHMFRGAETWPGSPVEYTIFRRLSWLVIQTADPKTRKANANSVNLNTIVSAMKQNEITNLINFYS